MWKIGPRFFFQSSFSLFCYVNQIQWFKKRFTLWPILLSFQYSIDEIFEDCIQTCIRESFSNYFPRSVKILAVVTFLERLYFLWFVQRQILKYSHNSKIDKRKSYRRSSLKACWKTVFLKNKTKFSEQTLAVGAHFLVLIYSKIPGWSKCRSKNNLRFLWCIRIIYFCDF